MSDAARKGLKGVRTTNRFHKKNEISDFANGGSGWRKGDRRGQENDHCQ